MSRENFGIGASRFGIALATWFLLLFALTLGAVLFARLSGSDPYTEFSPWVILIAYAPSLAALGAVAVHGGFRGVGLLLARVTRWRSAARWYILAGFGPFVLVLAANLLYQLAGGQPRWGEFLSFGALGASLGPLVAGSLGEEIGWRGFGQPLFQQGWTALTAALFVGFAWATWHLWPVLTPSGLVELDGIDVAQTYVRLISTAVIYAWLLNVSRGSLVLVMWAHAAHNLAIALMPSEGVVALIIALLYLVVALVVLALWDIATLANRRRPRSTAIAD